MEKALVSLFVFGSLIAMLAIFLGMNPKGERDLFAALIAGGLLLFLAGLGLVARVSK